MKRWVPLVALLGGCDPYARWPEPGTTFPWVYTPEEGLEPYETVRWETEDWDPAVDFDKVGLYVQKAVYHRPGAPLETRIHHGLMRARLTPVVRGDLRLTFVGDVMWTGGNWDRAFVRAAPLLDGDLRIGNLETPVSDAHPTELGALGLYSFNAPSSFLESLPLDVVQVNNNHSLDAGDEGLEATLEALRARGMVPTGVDEHALVAVDGVRVAFLSYTWGLNRPVKPTERELFIIPFGRQDVEHDLSRVADDASAARAEGADLVVVLVHWGYEYEYFSDPHFMVLGRELIVAGADVVVGSGPHVLQPAELCAVNVPAVVPGVGRCSVRTDDGRSRVAAILPSLGNFGAQPTFHTAPTEVGMVATVSLDPGLGVTGLHWEAVASVPEGDGEAVVPLGEVLDEPRFAEEAARLDAHLGTRWKRR